MFTIREFSEKHNISKQVAHDRLKKLEKLYPDFELKKPYKNSFILTELGLDLMEQDLREHPVTRKKKIIKTSRPENETSNKRQFDDFIIEKNKSVKIPEIDVKLFDDLRHLDDLEHQIKHLEQEIEYKDKLILLLEEQLSETKQNLKRIQKDYKKILKSYIKISDNNSKALDHSQILTKQSQELQLLEKAPEQREEQKNSNKLTLGESIFHFIDTHFFK